MSLLDLIIALSGNILFTLEYIMLEELKNVALALKLLVVSLAKLSVLVVKALVASIAKLLGLSKDNA